MRNSLCPLPLGEKSVYNGGVNPPPRRGGGLGGPKNRVGRKIREKRRACPPGDFVANIMCADNFRASSKPFLRPNIRDTYVSKIGCFKGGEIAHDVSGEISVSPCGWVEGVVRWFVCGRFSFVFSVVSNPVYCETQSVVPGT